MTYGRLQHLAAIATISIALPNATVVSPSEGAPALASAAETAAEAATPDAVADYVGGLAARLRTSDGTPVLGDIFLLAATPGSDAGARLFDQTPYRHDREVAAEALESNFAAVETVQTISGLDPRFLDFTTAPGGGSSGGLTYTIAYLNVVSNGAFTGDLRIAATGRIAPKGYIGPVSAINEKTAAAYLAGADVLFTPGTPASTHLERYSTRYVGEHNRVGLTAMTLSEKRQLDHYHEWGASRADGLDIVGVRHIADVAAYLCGARSPYACTIADHLAETSTGVGSTYDTPSYRDGYWNSYTNEWVPFSEHAEAAWGLAWVGHSSSGSRPW